MDLPTFDQADRHKASRTSREQALQCTLKERAVSAARIDKASIAARPAKPFQQSVDHVSGRIDSGSRVQRFNGTSEFFSDCCNRKCRDVHCFESLE
ncbi:hypothetical protein VI03_24645 [Burkholderia vietnamiensis]|nr:hypothetical protein VI03_24645 [Burkholderia vietnamiensis]